MNGPTGYNVRYRKARGHNIVQLPVRPSTSHNALQVYHALKDAGYQVEIWRSGERTSHGRIT